MIRSLAGEVAGGCGQEQVDRGLAIPDHAMGGAIGRLVAGGEKGVDLVVGPVDRAGRPCFLFALAAQLESGLDKRLCLGLPNLGIHWNTLFLSRPSRGRATGDPLENQVPDRASILRPVGGRSLPRPLGDAQVMLSDILGQQPVLQNEMMEERVPATAPHSRGACGSASRSC